MKDFERIDDLQKSRDMLVKAMYLAQKKLRDDAEKYRSTKPAHSVSLMTSALAVNEILFQYTKLVKDDMK